MTRRVEQIAKVTDSIFKKETQCSSDKRDENLVVVELNEDQNETTHTLNSALSYDCVERRTIKIMGDIISDGEI